MAHRRNLRDITDFELLLQYLQDNLEWPLRDYKLEEVTFTYEPAELGLKEEDAVKVRSIKQLRPLVHGQPWGIFFVEFEKKKLPVVLLRRILSHLVLKKRASANNADRARWDAKDLLFVSRFGDAADQELAFAHFKESMGDLPTLNVLGWDGGDTVLKLDHLQRDLEAHLHWPDDATNVDAWRKEWSTPFKHGVRHTIKKSDELAEVLAELARRIRDAATALMKVESEKGPLRRMHTAFKTALIHDLTEEGFADTYAQTITYGLLTAAISRTDMQGGKHGTALVADNVADMVPITNPFLKEMLQSFLKVGGRRGGIDFDELGVQDVVELLRSDDTDLPMILEDFGNKTQGEDPVIHFYEHFLAKYNKKLKVERGVFYTPKPVVGYIVRSVDELLRTEFGIEDGLASTITWREMAARNAELKIPEGTDADSPFVMVLDPATGTATFLVEVIDLVHTRLKENWSKGQLKAMPKLPATAFSRSVETFQDYWNQYVALSLLRRLHGYELMMAPYAIAHMKIGLKLWETGYRFGTEERARVYLTNALEPPNERIQLTIADWASALAHEAEAVNRIKRDQRFTVILGNPPYSKITKNLTPEMRAIVERYKYVDGVKIKEKGALQFEMNLQEDYVKFFCSNEARIMTTGVGILGFITNNGYLNTPTLRGMRSSFLRTFNVISALDLHGHRGEPGPDGIVDKNVFDIKKGVSILCAVSNPGSADTRRVEHLDLWGARPLKYEFLASRTTRSSGLQPVLPEAPHFLLVPQGSPLKGEWTNGIAIDVLFPKNSAGVLTSRDGLVISSDAKHLATRIRQFAVAKGSDEGIYEEFDFGPSKRFDLKEAQKEVRGLGSVENLIRPILQRPFDVRNIFFHPSLVWSLSRPIADQMLGENKLALVATRQVTRPQFEHVFVTRHMIEIKACSHDRNTQVFPLFLQGKRGELALSAEAVANISPQAIGGLASFLNLDTSSRRKILSPKAVFNYTYAILHSPTYRTRYFEFLRSEFPRIPSPGSTELFQALTDLGGELVSLHLLESPKLVKLITKFIGGVGPEVEKVSWSDNTVWIDKAQSIGFKGVPEAVWQYHIGGYQVCEKWLKDRGPKKGKPGRKLSAEDISHYQKIVVALSETIRIQKEIDEVIEQHGGWPGAFATNAPLAHEASEPLAQPKAKKPKAAKDLEPEDGPGYIPDPGEIPFA